MSAIRDQLAWNRLLAIVEEQAQTLMRTAFSTVVREAGDLSAGVFDTQGEADAPRRRSLVRFDRAALGVGDFVPGPSAIVESQTDSVVPAGSTARIDARGNIVIVRSDIEAVGP